MAAHNDLIPIPHLPFLRYHTGDMLPAKRQAGFTLIELIMTIVVVGVVAVPLSISLSQQMESVVESENYTFANNLARREMERIRNLAYVNVVSATSSNYLGYAFDVATTVTFIQGDGTTAESLKEITVDVKPAGSTRVLASATTYRTKNVAYGL